MFQWLCYITKPLLSVDDTVLKMQKCVCVAESALTDSTV